MEACRGGVSWGRVVEACRGGVSWRRVVEACRGAVPSPRDALVASIKRQTATRLAVTDPGSPSVPVHTWRTHTHPPDAPRGGVHLAEVHHVRQRVVVHEAQEGRQARADCTVLELHLWGTMWLGAGETGGHIDT